MIIDNVNGQSLNATNMSYKEASQALVKQLNLGNIQVSSYSNFLKNIIKRHMNKVYKEDGFEVTFDKWWIDTAKTLPVSFCKRKRKSLEVSLKALVTIRFTDKFSVKSESLPENSITVEAEITRFPHLTENGNFIINGVDKVLISHLEKADKLIVNPPNPKKDKQFGQLELKSRYGCTLTMDEKVCFRNVRKVLGDATSFTFEYNQLLQDLGYIEDALVNVIGMNNYIKTEDSSGNLHFDNSRRSANIFKILSHFYMDISERHCLNQKTSFSKNLTGKILAEDVTIGGELHRRGTILTAKEAELAQEEGILSIKVIDKGVESPILNNGFVDAESLFKSYGLDIPDDFKVETRNPLKQEETLIYYVKCNKEYFEELYRLYGHDKDQLTHQIELNLDKLIGTCLVKNDITAMMNLFSRCTLKLAEFDDIDNLENKKVVNIADIFEQGLIKAIGGSYYNDSKSIIGKIKKVKKDMSISTATESGTNLLLKMNLNLDCGEETITKDTAKISLFNVEDSTNPLAQINHKRKITLTYVEGRGGIKAMSPDVNARSVNPSYSGRIDCIETPESQVVGLVRQIGTLTHLDEFGQLEAPFFKVDHQNKVIDTSKIYYFTYGEEVSYKRVLSPKIAEDTGVKVTYYKGTEAVQIEFYKLQSIKNVQLDLYKKIAKRKMRQDGYTDFKIEVHKRNWFVDDIQTIIEGHGKTITGSPDDVDFVSCSGEHIFSPVTSAIPFIEYDDAARGMMGSVMSKQAISIWGAQKQLVRTPMAELIAPTATGVIVAPYDLEVVAVDALGIKVRDFYTGDIEYLPCLRQDRTIKTTLNKSTPIVKVGDICLKGDVLADSSSTKGGELAHGTNLLMAIVPLYGFNYEDGIIISSRLVKEDIYTSIHIEEVEVKINKKQKADKSILLAMGHEYEDLASNKYTDEAIIKRGVEVKPNDILAVKFVERKVKKSAKSKAKIEKNVPVVFRYEETVPGTVVSVEPHEDENGEDIYYTIKVVNRLKMGVGDKYTGRHGNKGITCCILPEEDMPFLSDGRRMDIVINPLGIPSRMNIGQLFDGHSGMVVNEIGMRAIVSVLANFNSDAFKHAIRLADCDKKQLYDGRTGKPFRYKSSVVMPYTEKLEHVVSHKIHARSNRPYTRKCQPTQGKARNGGQRLGEMEFWSLTALGAVNVQRELTMFKSDDVENRKAYIDALQDENTDWVTLENRSQNVSYAYQLSDIYYRSMFRRIAYYDADGNEIDISVSANRKDRSMAKTLEKIQNHTSSMINDTQSKVSQIVFNDDDDDEDEDDFNLGDFDFSLEDFSPVEDNSPTVTNLPKPKLNLDEVGYFDLVLANDEADDEEEEDNEDIIISEEQDENDLTGDEIFTNEEENEEFEEGYEEDGDPF